MEHCVRNIVLERKIKELDTIQRSSVSMNGNTPSTRFVVSVRQLVHDLTVNMAHYWARYYLHERSGVRLEGGPRLLVKITL